MLIFALTLRQCNFYTRPIQHSSPSVITATAIQKNMAIYVPALGNVTPVQAITLRAQVDGELLHVYFKEGQLVHTGDLLADIDARPYQAQLMQYEGQLARDQAQLSNAKRDLIRYQALVLKNNVSTQTRDTQDSLTHQLEGAVQSDQGLIDNAKVNLAYTHITSPINGRIGLRLVDPGNIVHTTDTTGIATLTSLDPITVEFALPEDDLPKLLPQWQKDKTLLIKIYDRTNQKMLATGKVIAVDNQVDTSTGTVLLKASCPNPDNHLFPNEFVNVQLLIETLENAIVIPTAAVQYGPHGTYVYRIHHHTAIMQSITVGSTQGDATAVIQGLAPSDVVVIDGLDQLSDSTKVTVAKSE